MHPAPSEPPAPVLPQLPLGTKTHPEAAACSPRATVWQLGTSPGEALPAAKCIGDVGGSAGWPWRVWGHGGGIVWGIRSGKAICGFAQRRCQLSREIRAGTGQHLVCKAVREGAKPVTPGRPLCAQGVADGACARERGGGDTTHTRQNTGRMATACPPLPFLGVTAFAPRSLLPPPLHPRCPLHPPPSQERGGGQTREPKRAVAELGACRVLAPTATLSCGGDPGHPGLHPRPVLEPSRRRSQTAPRGPFTLGLLHPARGRLAIMLIP